MRILSLDPSLTGTGVTTITTGRDGTPTVTARTLKTRLLGHDRLAWILEEIGSPDAWDLVVIEGPAYGSQASRQSGHHERAGLWWLIAHRLWRHGIPYAVVPPNARAKYAAGKGNASKGEVMAAVIRRYGHLVDIGDDNQADSVATAAMAAHHLQRPLLIPPAAHCTALTAVKWPDVTLDENADPPLLAPPPEQPATVGDLAGYREHRRRHGVLLKDVAGQLGVDPRTVSRWETGRMGMSPDTRDRYLAAIDYPQEDAA